MRRMVEGDIYSVEPKVFKEKDPFIEKIHNGDGLEILQHIKQHELPGSAVPELVQHLIVHGWAEQIFKQRTELYPLPESEVISLLYTNGAKDIIKKNLDTITELPEYIFKELHTEQALTLQDFILSSRNLSAEVAEKAITDGHIDLLLTNLDRFEGEKIPDILKMAIDTGYHVHVSHFLPNIPENYQEQALRLLLDEAKDQIHELFGQPIFVDFIQKRLPHLKQLSATIARECLDVGMIESLLDEIKSFDDEARIYILSQALENSSSIVQQKILTTLPYVVCDQRKVIETLLAAGNSKMLVLGATWFEPIAKKFLASATIGPHPELIAANLGAFEELNNDVASALIEHGYADKVFDHRYRFPNYPISELLSKVSPEKALVILAENLPKLQGLDARQGEMLLLHGKLDSVLENITSFKDIERNKIITQIVLTREGREAVLKHITPEIAACIAPESVHVLAEHIIQSRATLDKVKSFFTTGLDQGSAAQLETLFSACQNLSPDTIKLLLSSGLPPDEVLPWLKKVSGTVDESTSHTLTKYNTDRLTKTAPEIDELFKTLTIEGRIIRNMRSRAAVLNSDILSKYTDIPSMSLPELEKLIINLKKRLNTSNTLKLFGYLELQDIATKAVQMHTLRKKLDPLMSERISMRDIAINSCSVLVPSDQASIALTLHAIGENSYLPHMITKASLEAKDTIARRFIENGKSHVVGLYIESFENLSEKTAVDLAANEEGHVVLENINRFKITDTTNILNAMDKEKDVRAIADHLDLFPQFTHEEIAQKIISLGHMRALDDNLSSFEDLSNETASILIKNSNVNDVLWNLQSFKKFDEETGQTIATWLLRIENPAVLAEHAEKFTDATLEVYVKNMKTVKAEREILAILEHLDKFPAHLHAEIFEKTIAVSRHPKDWIKKYNTLHREAMTFAIEKLFTSNPQDRSYSSPEDYVETMSLIKEIPEQFHPIVLSAVLDRANKESTTIYGTNLSIFEALLEELPSFKVNRDKIIDFVQKDKRYYYSLINKLELFEDTRYEELAVWGLENKPFDICASIEKFPTHIHEKIARRLAVIAQNESVSSDAKEILTEHLLPHLKKFKNLSPETLTQINDLTTQVAT